MKSQIVCGLSAMLIASAVFQPAPAGGQTRYEKTTVAYRAVGEHEVLVDVHRPAGHDERQVIVWIHGGALIMGGREGVPQRIVSLAKEQGPWRDSRNGFRWAAPDTEPPLKLARMGGELLRPTGTL